MVIVAHIKLYSTSNSCRSKLNAFTDDEPSVQNLLRHYFYRKLTAKKDASSQVPPSLLVGGQLPSLEWLHKEYAKRIELEVQIPIELRVSIRYFRILKFYDYETSLLLAGGISLGCLSLYYSSKVLYDHVIKYMPSGPFGLSRLAILGSAESLLFHYCTQLATLGYFLPRQYLVRRKVLSGDYMTVSEYYAWFLDKYPNLALPVVSTAKSRLASITLPPLSAETKSWITLAFLSSSSAGKVGFKLILFAKIYPILATNYKQQRVKISCQKSEKVKLDIDFFLSCL